MKLYYNGITKFFSDFNKTMNYQAMVHENIDDFIHIEADEKGIKKMQRNMPIIPIQLDSSTAIKISMGGSMFQERNLMGRTDVWHQIKIVKGAQYPKDTVLKLILNAVEPADLLPIKYQKRGEDSFFMARNCGPALEKLCKTNLLLKNPGGGTLILQVTLGFALINDLKINIQPVLITVMTNRYNSNQKSLNLESFHTDQCFSDMFYCPLSITRIFAHVLKLIDENCPLPCEILNLQCNDLVSITALENLTHASIKNLDLRHNNLANIDCLNPVKKQPITKLWLDGNPVCENYVNSTQYIQSVKNYFPGIIQLDGVYLERPGIPGLICPYYLKDRSKEGLIKSFITHFFNFYDQGVRTDLRGLYHENAFYSMSCSIPGAVAQKRKLSQYTANRNLIKNVDPAKKNKHLFCGRENILLGLKKLPQSYHDIRNLTYDVLYDDENYLVLSVSGFFKSLHKPVQVLFFNRTFVLLPDRDNEYKILNDQYHLDAAPEAMKPDSIEIIQAYEFGKTVHFTATEKTEIATKFANVTTLNDEWCSSYLLEANWDIRKAIKNFMKDYKSSTIPPDGFIQRS